MSKRLNTSQINQEKKSLYPKWCQLCQVQIHITKITKKKKIGGVREKTVHTFKTLIQHRGWIPRSASLDLVTAPSGKWIKKMKKKKGYKNLHFNMGIARRKWKIEQQAGKAESSYFKKWSLIWREQFLPAKFAHAFLQARAMQQVWTCLCLSWQQHGGEGSGAGTQGWNKSFWQMPVLQFSAVHGKAEDECQPCCCVAAWWAQLLLLTSLCIFGVYSSLFHNVHQNRHTAFLSTVTVGFSEIMFTTSEFKVRGKTC